MPRALLFYFDFTVRLGACVCVSVCLGEGGGQRGATAFLCSVPSATNCAALSPPAIIFIFMAAHFRIKRPRKWYSYSIPKLAVTALAISVVATLAVYDRRSVLAPVTAPLRQQEHGSSDADVRSTGFTTNGAFPRLPNGARPGIENVEQFAERMWARYQQRLLGSQASNSTIVYTCRNGDLCGKRELLHGF